MQGHKVRMENLTLIFMIYKSFKSKWLKLLASSIRPKYHPNSLTRKLSVLNFHPYYMALVSCQCVKNSKLLSIELSRPASISFNPFQTIG